MPRWTPAPIVGGAYKDDARAFSVQDTVNWIPERAEAEGTRSDGLLRDAPGAHVICDLGTNAPIRGLHNAEGRLLAVSGNTLFEVGADFLATSRGTVPGVSRVSIAHNQITDGNEVLIANGQSGYVYNTVTEALAQITDVSYPGAIVVDYLAQVLVQIEPQRRFWFHSDVTQAMQYISTDQYEAESAPDLLVTLIASHGQLLVLGDRTGEFYAATGGNTSFFERMEGTTMEVGCASAHSVVRLDSTVFWIGSDGKGYRLNGYNAQRITTHAIEQAWSRCDLKKAFAFTFEDRGHTIVYFTFPDGATWGYDVATQEWHRRKSKDMNRWRMNALVYWNGHWIGGDYASGKLYRLDWDHKLECCDPLVRERISGVLHDNQNAVGVNAAEFVFETGGAASESFADTPPIISGSLPDAKVGDVISYQYTITRATPGQVVSLTLTGALPTGLTLDSNGLVTGTLLDSGVFSWSITPTTACATGVALADSTQAAPLAAYFDGVSDYLTAPLAAPIIASGDFTIQVRVSVDVVGNYGIVSGRNSNIRGWSLSIKDGAPAFRMSMNTGLIDTTNNLQGGSLDANTMTHIAITRNGDLFTLWQEGAEIDTYTNAGTIDEPSVTQIAIGTSYAAIGESTLLGYVDWLAINIGECLYTSPFTPPRRAADVVGAKVSLDFNEAIGSTTFGDTGLLGLTWTRTGDVVIAEYPYT